MTRKITKADVLGPKRLHDHEPRRERGMTLGEFEAWRENRGRQRRVKGKRR